VNAWGIILIALAVLFYWVAYKTSLNLGAIATDLEGIVPGGSTGPAIVHTVTTGQVGTRNLYPWNWDWQELGI
jgi:hypothetical protein